MKTQIISAISACLFSLMIVSSATAQRPKDNMLPVVTITATGTNVTAKLRQAFERSFKNAEKMYWFRANENYLVNFIQNDQSHKALFTKNGGLVYHIAYGHEKNLPAIVRHQIKSKYYDYQISRVFNIKQNSRNIWLVNLEDKNDIIFARVEDGQMNEVNRLTKIEYTDGALTRVDKKN